MDLLESKEQLLQVIKQKLREKDKQISKAQSERSELSRQFKKIAKEIKALSAETGS